MFQNNKVRLCRMCAFCLCVSWQLIVTNLLFLQTSMLLPLVLVTNMPTTMRRMRPPSI